MTIREFEGTSVIIRELVICVTLMVLYGVLFHSAVSYLPSPFFHIPEWWYPTLGRNNASAVLWMQLENSIKVIAAAIPIAFIISYSFGKRWLRMSLAVGLLAAVAILLIIAVDFHFMMQRHSIEIEPWVTTSAMIDALKIAAILVGATWALACILPSNKAQQRTDHE